jgi:hypothetical protein
MKFEVLREGTRDGAVWLWGQDGGDIILGAISSEALEDDASPVQRQLSGEQLITLASANAEPINRVLNAKPTADARPRIWIKSGDLRSAGEVLSASILAAPPFRWSQP